MKFDIKRRSFYISLCVCVMAISAAGWSTYKSIKDFSESDQRTKSHNLTPKLRRKTAEEIPKPLPLPKKSETKKQVSSQTKDNEKVKEVSARASSIEFIIPVEYSECSKFNDDLEYSEKYQDWRTSDGVDFKSKPDAEVYSIANGKVIEVFDDPLYGMTLKIEHHFPDNSEVIAYYSGLSDISLREGNNVLQGQKISQTKEENMHFMLQVNGKFVDPHEFLDIK